jgi:hypothetical protein
MTSLNDPATADHPVHSGQFAIRDARYALPASHANRGDVEAGVLMGLLSAGRRL